MMAKLESIQAKIARLQAEAAAIVKKQSLTAIAKISELMEEHGLTFADLQSHLGGRRRGRPKAGARSADRGNGIAKYVDPKSGATWTGRGRAPAWIANAKNRDRFVIDTGAQRQASAIESASKAGNYVRGPQAPKYRDPETGATWSGRGRAPAWLAEVKDRTAFLIDGKGEVAPKTAAAKRSMAKKTVVKKAATRKTMAGKAVAEAAASKKRGATAKKAIVKKVASGKAASKANAAKAEAASMDVPA
jgi:DNA-binding protein H-NS